MGVKTYRIRRNGRWLEPFNYPTLNQARWVLCQRPGGEVVEVESRFARSWASDRHQVVTDADLHVGELSFAGLDREIQDALRDAVGCFRAELYRPSLVMLRRASEGAWVESGLALAALAARDDPEGSKLAEAREVVAFCERRPDIFEPLAQGAGLTIDGVRRAMLWSDMTGAEATCETVATLLVTAVPHLWTICSLGRAARNAKRPPRA